MIQFTRYLSSMLIALTPLTVWSATITVPGDAPTIQAAIDAATDGDIIVVSPGTYLENDVRFNGKAVELRGAGGADSTIIDGAQQGPVLKVIDGEGRGTIIDGFTIRNGRANFQFEGGGIFITGSSPTVRNNRVVNNVNLQPNGAGGGIKVSPGSNPLIENNLVQGNTAFGNGGGMRLREASAVLRNNRWVDNRAQGDPDANGGGISLSASTVPIVIDGDEFTGNAAGSVAGALSIFDVDVTVTNGVFTGNSAPNFAGGIRIEDGRETGGRTVTVSNSTFTGNSTLDKGGAIHLFFEAGDGDAQTGGSTVTISGNTFSANTAANDGCAADLDLVCAEGGAVQAIRFTGNSRFQPAWGQMIVTDNIFENNSGDNYGAAQFNATNLDFANNVVRGNTAKFRYPGISCEYNADSEASCLVRGNRFFNNAATMAPGSSRNAGGIYIKDPTTATVENNFFGQLQGDRGSAIYYINTVGGFLGVTANTFAGNSATFAGGASVYLDGDAEVVANIFSGDLRGVRLDDEAQMLVLADNNFTDQATSVVRIGATEFADTGALDAEFISAGGSSAETPGFVDENAEDLRLAGSSVLVDTLACQGLPPVDIDADPRPLGNGCEPGADEFNAAEFDTLFANGFEG